MDNYESAFYFYIYYYWINGFEKRKTISDPYLKVSNLEKDFADAINDKRFIPYIQLHEFEYTNIKATGYRHEYGKKVYIDELEGFINYLCFNRFGGYTIDATQQETYNKP